MIGIDQIKTHQAPLNRVTAIINMTAGSTSDISLEMRRMFKNSGIEKPDIQLVEAGELSAALDKVSKDDTDLLVIFGGDGTCKAGAVTAKRTGIPLIVLPGGTMNLLPKALYGTTDWREALQIGLSVKTPRWLQAGSINGQIFLAGLLIGDPIIMAEAREHIRDGDVLEATRKIPDIMSAIRNGENFEISVDGKVFDRKTNLLNLSCPITSGISDPDKFEFTAVPNLNTLDLIEIAATIMIDDMRQSDIIKVGDVRTVDITGQGAFSILVDGEPSEVSCPISIYLDPKGVQVLAP